MQSLKGYSNSPFPPGTSCTNNTVDPPSADRSWACLRCRQPARHRPERGPKALMALGAVLMGLPLGSSKPVGMPVVGVVAAVAFALAAVPTAVAVAVVADRPSD